MKQQEKDAVTVGEIRKLFEEKLDAQIDDLKKIIKRGYIHRHEADSYMKNTIHLTLKQLDDLDTYAGLPNLIKTIRGQK